MMTVPGHIWKKRTAESYKTWTDKHTAVAFCVCACLTYIVFFSPILRYDGIPYVSPARSLVIDHDLNTYNESFYYSHPGWNNVQSRQIKGYTRNLISYVSAPAYTTRGYRYVVFPIGNILTWYPAIWASHTVWSGVSRWNSNYAADGFSFPYIIALGLWSFLIGWGGMVTAYRILRFWYDPGPSCGAACFIYASSNLIPFLTRDVTFSHSVDFLLVNLSILLFLHIQKKKTFLNSIEEWNLHFLWGMFIGYACIVRYQDMALLLLPLTFYLSQGMHRFTRNWKQPVLFLFGFLFLGCLQLLYWKILYGTCFIARQTMGVGNLASFNPWKPQIIPMFFSRFHGIYNWMPWLLPVSIGFFLFIKRDKWVGILLGLIMISQFYYMASRSEWWNLGFSVRRITGWLIIYMIGAAEIATLCKKRFMKNTLIVLTIPIVVWAWLFLINYQVKEPDVNILPHLIGDATPFLHNNFKPVLPSISVLVSALTGLKTWFLKYALVGKIYLSIQNKSIVTAVLLVIFHFLIIGLCCGFIVLLFSKRAQVKKLCLGLFFAYVILFYGVMIISDCSAENIYTQKIIKGEKQSGFQQIRINNVSRFEGENSVLPLIDTPIRFDYPLNTGKISCYCLIGLSVDSNLQSTVIRAALTENNKNLKQTLIRLGDKSDSCIFELQKPWGDAEYFHRWFRVEIKLDIDDDTNPDAWELSLVKGEDVVIGAFWHSHD